MAWAHSSFIPHEQTHRREHNNNLSDIPSLTQCPQSRHTHGMGVHWVKENMRATGNDERPGKKAPWPSPHLDKKSSVDDAHPFIDDDFISEDEALAVKGEPIQFNHDGLHFLNMTNGGTSALSCGNRGGTLCPVPLEAWGHSNLKGACLWLLGEGSCNGSIGAIHEDCLARARDLGRW